jgi:hypothetical protein
MRISETLDFFERIRLFLDRCWNFHEKILLRYLVLNSEILQKRE